MAKYKITVWLKEEIPILMNNKSERVNAIVIDSDNKPDVTETVFYCKDWLVPLHNIKTVHILDLDEAID